MANAPSFTGTPRIDSANFNANSDIAAANATLVFTAGASGSLITRIDVIQAQGANTADSIYLFWYDGSNYRLWKTVDMENVTVAAGTPPFQATLLYPEGLPVPGSGFNRLYAGSEVGLATTVTVYSGDF